ncbi:MAG: hypothetical protein WA996_06840 [Candidatus Promineifilaceae bacterium]
MGIRLEAETGQEVMVDERKAFSWLTLEHVLYGAILLVGAITRFIDLGRVPLSPDEALQALAVWNTWQPGTDSIAIISPAYHSLTAPLSQVLGFSDALMRLVPAFFGLALVLLPWWIKQFTGRLGALIAALLIAVSPILVISSRTVDGSSIALFAGFLLLVGWLNYQQSNRPIWLYTMSFTLGLGLTSATLFYSLIVTMSLAWIGQALLGPALFRDDHEDRRPLYHPDTSTLRNSALIFLGTFFIIGSGFLLNLGGIGATARIFAEWIAAFLAPADVQDWLRPISALIRYEMILLLLGGSAVVWATWRGKPFPMLLVYWMVSALLLLFVQRGVMSNTMALALPGFLIIGSFVDAIMRADTGRLKWFIALTVAAVGVVAYVNLGRYSRLLPSELDIDIRAGYYHLLLVFLAIVVVLLVLVILWSGQRRASVQGLIIGLLVLLVGYSWSTALWLGKEAANDPREPWVTSASDDDIRLLTSTIKQVSWQVKGSDSDLDIYSTIDNPSLDWYLRELKSFDKGIALPLSITSSGLLTELDREPQLASEYIGIDLGYSRPEGDYPVSPSQLLVWWLFHEAPTPLIEERLIFWLRSDLAGVG